MIEDMTVRKLGSENQRNYLRAVKTFATFLGHSPDTSSFEDVRRFQLHLAQSGVGVPTLNGTVSALRFFFKVTLGRPEIENHTQIVREVRKLPRVLSPEEVVRLIEAAPGPGLKYKAALSVACGAGLRASEVVSLKITDIDSKRMMIRVEVVPVHAFGMTQGPQGSVCHALTAVAGTAARLVEALPIRRLAVPGS